jgi:hypothetical protein
MGIFNRFANAIAPSSGKDEEKSPESGKKKKAVPGYRHADFITRRDATRRDLEKVMSELVKSGAMKEKDALMPGEATREDYARKLEGLVSRSAVEREDVELTLEEVIDDNREKIKAAVEAGKVLNEARKKEILARIKNLFEKYIADPEHKEGRKSLKWDEVRDQLESDPEKLFEIDKLVKKRGYPDKVVYDKKTGGLDLKYSFGEKHPFAMAIIEFYLSDIWKKGEDSAWESRSERYRRKARRPGRHKGRRHP